MTKVKKSAPHQPKKPAPSTSVFSSLSPTARDILCVLFLYAVTLFLFRGIIFDNAAFASEGDTAAALSYQHAGLHILETEGVDPLWMPYFFSGMPTFGNVAFLPHDVSYAQLIVVKVLDLFYLNGKWTWLVVYYFLHGLFMFFLMRVWKFSRPAALLAALAVMLSPYSIGLAGEGHGSKLMALTYLPLVFMLTHLLFERRNLLSFGLLTVAIGTMLLTNHMQIVYYAFLVIGLYLVYQVAVDLKTARGAAALKTLLFVGALMVGLCISAYIYLSVYEYSQFSMRGGGTAGSSGGLAYDYATNWSWSPWEFLTLLMPSFYGFQPPYYWGHIMPWTNSTVYIGIIPIVFAVIALVYRRNRITIFMAILTAVVFLMSFGNNLSFFYQLLFSYLPFFNKFRAPAMVLQVLPFTAGFLAAIGFAYILDAREHARDIKTENLQRFLLYAAGILGALFVIALLFKSTISQSVSSFMFLKEGETDQYLRQYGQQRGGQIIIRLKEARFDMFWKDFIKFTLIAGVSLGVVWAFLRNKLTPGIFAGTIIGILIIDLAIIDGKLINPQPSTALEQAFRPDATVTFLQQQPGLFRVFPLGQDLFMDNTYAYHAIQSIGGYSPAKLRIYQTMIDSCLYHGADPAFPLNMNIVDMLNVKYLIGQVQLPAERFPLVNADKSKQLATYENPAALPRAFFVHGAIVASNEHDVFATLNAPDFNPARTAVLQKPLAGAISPPDSSQDVTVGEYQSRKILIKTRNQATSLLVLSEVYYPAGWKAFVDGTETEIYRTNYILRSVVVPAGSHEVLFTFDPPMYRLGWLMSNSAWGVAAICILGGLWATPSVRQRLRRKENPPEPQS